MKPLKANRKALEKAIFEATISLRAIAEPEPNSPPDARICKVLARSALIRMETALGGRVELI